MGVVAGLGALAGGAMGLFGGGNTAANVQLPPPLPGVQSAANQGLAGLSTLGGYNLYDIPTASNISYGLVNNPYAAQFQAGAGPAGQMGQAAGVGAFGAGQNLYNAGNQILSASGAYNPTPLYNYLQNQTMQQANAENAAAGVATTPYGAGVANMANQQFNLAFPSWLQGQQLAALGGAGQAFGQGAALQAGAPQTYLQGAGLPYATFGGIGQSQLGALSGLGGFGSAAQGVANVPIQEQLAYAQGGQQLNNQQAQLALNQANSAYLQNLGFGGMIGGGLGALGNTGWGSNYGLSGLFNRPQQIAPGYYGSPGGTGGLY